MSTTQLAGRWDAPIAGLFPRALPGERWDVLATDEDDEVPERPALAPGVRLAGEMQGTAFARSQWLIERNGRFLQVSEPLYRVAEQLDGRRTHAEVAAAVREATGCAVTSLHVREIVRLKLLPAGVVLDAYDLPVLLPQSTVRSPLQVALRTKAIGPRVLDPLTAVLQWLFAPAALLPLLAVIAAMQYWLFAVHGIHEPLKTVIFTPALVLVVAPVMILSGLVHELGHASGLRYGGGRARRIGAGLYLVWPAFFTDTTDSYRLSRAGRVRTDLGGFYFHLLFSLVLVGAYLLTGAEFLLFAVLLIDIEILQQLLFPFARLDGYWLLADLTGIPDFFSQAGPFVRGLLRRGPAERRLPALRTWPARVFGVYLAIVVPLLCFLLYLTVRRLPGLVDMTWRSLLAQRDQLWMARANGDGLGVALSIVQMVILSLPLLTTVAMLVITAVWIGALVHRRRAARRHAR